MTHIFNVRPRRVLAIAALAAVVAAPMPLHAQSSMGSREFQQAELNELQLREPASRIVGVDMGRGVVVVQQQSGTMKAYSFNKQDGLKIVGEVSLTR
jgi:hypothetical protein